MIKEAMLYETLDGKKVQCNVCAHNCVISDGKTGICGTRKNEEGILYTLIYNSATSATPDPIEKKPLYHFHPGSTVFSLGTVGCNFKCKHCQNMSISFAKVGEVPMTEISVEESIKYAKRSKCGGVAWTYNEPTIWFEYTYDGAKLAKENGLYTVYVTNGYISEDALDKIAPYLDAANVDVKAFTDGFYKRVSNAKLEPVLRTCERMLEKGIHIELTYLVIPTYNDDPDELRRFAEWVVSLGEDTPVHFSRFHPLGEMSHLYSTPIETLETAHAIAKASGIKYVYIGNVHGHKYDNTYCPECGRLLVERIGFGIMKTISGRKCPNCGSDISIVY
jgi:pyruvate formate lyase activating enzyme